MRSWKKRSISAALALTCVAAPMAQPMTAYAASTAEKILYGAAAMLFISSYYSRMDDESQLQLLDQCQQETGVYDSAEADNRVQTVITRSTCRRARTSMRLPAWAVCSA